MHLHLPSVRAIQPQAFHADHGHARGTCMNANLFGISMYTNAIPAQNIHAKVGTVEVATGCIQDGRPHGTRQAALVTVHCNDPAKPPLIV